MNELQRHGAVEAELVRPKNHSHPPARDLGEQFVIAEGMELDDQRRGGFDKDRGEIRRFQWSWISRQFQTRAQQALAAHCLN